MKKDNKPLYEPMHLQQVSRALNKREREKSKKKVSVAKKIKHLFGGK